MKSADIKLSLTFLFISFIVLFFLSPDSYTHDLYFRNDSACFFTCGKAWMNGMLPYLEFSDSKGPILWLIYGIGYLIDNNSYIGVFWLSVLFYSFTYYICYKIIYIFLCDSNKALIGSILMTFPFFITWIHYEIRAEDFCMPFIALQLYLICRLIIYKSEIQNCELNKYSILMGVSFAFCFYIKWSIAIMSLIFFFSVIALFHKKVMTIILYYFIGFIVISIPLIIYFSYTNTLSNFINEYLFATYDTVKAPFIHILHYYITEEWKVVLTTRLFIFIIYILFSIIIGIYFKKLYFFPFIWTLWFISICLRNGTFHQYYLTASSIFCIFTIIIILKWLPQNFFSKKNIFVFILGTIFINVLGNIHSHKNLFFMDEYRNSYYEVSNIINQKKKAKILFQGLDNGIGIAADVLPACKYWIKQNGATENMIKERTESINNQEADFIIVNNLQDSVFLKLIDDNGYVYLSKTIDGVPNKFAYLYGKPIYNQKKSFNNISNLDILLKRNILSTK